MVSPFRRPSEAMVDVDVDVEVMDAEVRTPRFIGVRQRELCGLHRFRSCQQ